MNQFEAGYKAAMIDIAKYSKDLAKVHPPIPQLSARDLMMYEMMCKCFGEAIEFGLDRNLCPGGLPINKRQPQ